MHHLVTGLYVLILVDIALVALMWRAQTRREREREHATKAKPQTDGGPGIPPASQ